MQKRRNYKKNGATIVEYSLLIVMLILVAVAGANFLGNSMSSKLVSLGSTISSRNDI